MVKHEGVDCMAMKRRLQRRFYRETRDMSPAELIAHIRERVETCPFSEFWHDAPQARVSRLPTQRAL
jgi:protein-disulfide isomerase-like protein with CxxC motif